LSPKIIANWPDST